MKIMYFGDNKTFYLANVVQEYFLKRFLYTFKYFYSSEKPLKILNIVIEHKTNLESNDGEKVSRKFKSSRDLTY